MTSRRGTWQIETVCTREREHGFLGAGPEWLWRAYPPGTRIDDNADYLFGLARSRQQAKDDAMEEIRRSLSEQERLDASREITRFTV